MSKYRRIRYEDRCQIYALSKRGTSQESIARILGVSQSAVSREMRRNRGQRGYRFKQAEATAHARQAIRSKPRKLTAPIRREIEAKLRQMRWSPEQISGWLSEQGIKLSHERIYQMIWDQVAGRRTTPMSGIHPCYGNFRQGRSQPAFLYTRHRFALRQEDGELRRSQHLSSLLRRSGWPSGHHSH